MIASVVFISLFRLGEADFLSYYSYTILIHFLRSTSKNVFAEYSDRLHAISGVSKCKGNTIN
jgi:hypothetical protein